MARILLAWELGGGLGHVMPLAALGGELKAAGHDCAFALRDLVHAHGLFRADRARLYQSPIFLPDHRAGALARTYADILANIGYRQADALTGLIAAWRRIYEDFRPDLIVFDHAPTAIAAARDLDVPFVHIARSGFTIPPSRSPLPALRDGDDAANLEREKAVARVLNDALGMLHLPGIDAVGQLFARGARVLLSVPELDPYGPRDDVDYWGPMEHGHGLAPEWPPLAGKKIFAYLRNFPARDALLGILARCGHPVLAHVSGMDAAECARHSTQTLHISPAIVDARAALAACDLVVTHGGSLVSSALLAGKPLLTLPLHLEQQLTAAKAATLGASLNAPKLAPGGMQAKLERLLRERAFADAAQAFRQRHANAFPPLPGRFAALVDTLLRTV